MKYLIKNLLLFLVAGMLVAACSAKSSIVGKWLEDGDDKEVLEFFQDGTVNTVSGRMSLVGKYNFIADDRMKLELGGMGALAGPMLFQVSIAGGQLKLTDTKGKVSTYHRAR